VSNPVQAIRAVDVAAQTPRASPAPKTQQTATKTAALQDKVTISPQARQAQTGNSKPATSGDVDHDGNKH
jgi:hypothetical protein